MRSVDQVPSLVPDVTVYIVLDHFGRPGPRIVRPTKNNASRRIQRSKAGSRVPTAEKWSSDVSEDVAGEVLARTSSRG